MPDCGKYLKPAYLDKHLYLTHANQMETCENCKKMFTPRSFKMHLSKCLTSEGTIGTVSDPEKSVESPSEDKAQQTDKNYVCPVNYCNASFAKPKYLKRHTQEVHGKSKKCPIQGCHKFMKLSSLKKHLSIVHRKQMKSCENCQKKVTINYYLDHKIRCLGSKSIIKTEPCPE